MIRMPPPTASSRPVRNAPTKYYLIVRVGLALGIVVIGVTLHYHGGTYEAIRAVYLVAILALVIWRIRSRRWRRGS